MMQSTAAILAITLAGCHTILSAQTPPREVTYIGASFGSEPLPTFDKGYLLFLKRPCRLVVYEPTGKLAFDQPVRPDCSPAGVAVDTDGTIAVSIGFPGPTGYSAGIVLLDRRGRQLSFIETNRYLPSHLCFDHDHNIWSIGWQRDAILNGFPDTNDYQIVRKFSRTGTQIGAYIAKSLWKGKA